MTRPVTNATWVPGYPILTLDWAVRVRDEFAGVGAAGQA